MDRELIIARWHAELIDVMNARRKYSKGHQRRAGLDRKFLLIERIIEAWKNYGV